MQIDKVLRLTILFHKTKTNTLIKVTGARHENVEVDWALRGQQEQETQRYEQHTFIRFDRT